MMRTNVPHPPSNARPSARSGASGRKSALLQEAIFSNAARVEVQGAHALQLLADRPQRKTYGVPGLHNRLVVEDYRPEPPASTPNAAGWERLNRPAHVTIRRREGEPLIVELHPTDRKRCNFTLWIAVGLEEFIPQQDCVFDQVGFLEDDRFALLALLKGSRAKPEPEDWSFLSV